MSDAGFRALMDRAGVPAVPATVPQEVETDEAPALRRESNILPWTLGALGAGALGVAAMKRPGIAAKLEELWQKPLGPLERWTKPRSVELPHIGIPGMPSELPIVRNNPESRLISKTEEVGSNMAKGYKGLSEQPFYKDILAERPDVIKDIEASRVANFLTNMATGMTPSAAKAASLASAPQWFRDYDAFRAARLGTEQAAKRFLGMEPVPVRSGPYLPRDTIRNEAASLRDNGGLFGELRTSLHGSEQARRYGTMREGEAAGVVYEDPRVAFLNREVASMRLEQTANYLAGLEGRVIFRDPGAARAAAGLPATAPVYTLEAVPGAPKWFVPHKEEWKFLIDNLKDPEFGKLGFLRMWGNTLSRNPNLINPLPHIVKNMAYKYTLAGGNLAKLPADFMEFRQGTSPMVTAFKAAMPFDDTGMTASQMFQRAVHGIRSEQWPMMAKLVDLGLDATIGAAQRASAKTIFATADPAMRFSLWKNYVGKGMSANEAANNVWVDLIRYGTRSTVVDAWKSVPFNFFVPWRLGTTTTLYKQITDHPFRTAAIIGGIDLLREIRYRQTGRWTHLPIDYVEQPIAQILQAKDGQDAAKSLLAATLATVAFGPGGGFAASTIKDVMDDVQMRGEWGRLRNVFWGVSQLVDGGQSAIKIFQHMQNGRTDMAASDAGNLLMTAATAEHSALNYRPRRLLAALPEVGPWLAKSAAVKAAEAMQQTAEIRGEHAQQRRDVRKGARGTIEDRVLRMQEAQP